MMDVVNIIIPVYRVEQYLDKCIQSVIAQPYTRWQAILVDDGSPDTCPLMCDTYAAQDSRISVRHIANGGLANARNVGLTTLYGGLADPKSQYVMFLDSDDYLSPDCLETLVTAAHEHDAAIVNMAYRAVGVDGSIISEGSQGTKTCQVFASSEYLHHMCYKQKTESACTKLYRMDVISGNRFETGTLNEDFLFNSLLCFKEFNIIDMDYSGYNYLQRSGSTSHSGANKAYFDSIRNPLKLMRAAEEENRLELIPDFARVALYQIRCISFVLPLNMIWRGSKDFSDLLHVLHNCYPYLSQCTFPRGYKSILKFIYRLPKLTCSVLSLSYSVKNIIR